MQGDKARPQACSVSHATAALVFSALLLAAASSRSEAQQPSSDVAYVEDVQGRVFTISKGRFTQLEALDIVDERAELVLEDRSQLRLCHYRQGKLIRLNGPGRAEILRTGVVTPGTWTTDPEACAAPIVSSYQGGIVTRSFGPGETTQVSERPTIKIVNKREPLRNIVLMDGADRARALNLDQKVLTPILEHGKSYHLVLQQSGGGLIDVALQASRQANTGPLIVVIR
ncbi:MAG: hypothetical protein ACJ8F3_18410 [Xanthobacteraceae bacterium]